MLKKLTETWNTHGRMISADHPHRRIRYERSREPTQVKQTFRESSMVEYSVETTKHWTLHTAESIVISKMVILIRDE